MTSSMSRLAALSLLFGVGGCGQLWGIYSMPDPENCVRTPSACQTGEYCNLQTQACEPLDLTPVDPYPPPTAPTTFLSPGGTVSTLTYPRDVRYTLASVKPAALYYTIDGTTPMAGQLNTFQGMNQLVVGKLTGGTKLTWLGDYGPTFNAEAPHTFTPVTDPNPPTTAGSISEDVQFAKPDPMSVIYNLGPVVLVPRGARMNVRIAFQVWTGSSGNGRLQYVVSVETLGAVGCLDNVQRYGPYPGTSLVVFVSFNVPSVPGRYPVYAGITFQQGCDHTKTAGPEIGQIFVQ